jgi:tRNA (guanine-N7-)-methyltransferase
VGADRPRQGNQKRGELTRRAVSGAQGGAGERAGGSFYGRRKGRPLRAGQREAIESVLPRLRIDVSKEAPAALSALFDVPVSEVRLEIGFGGGEHLLDAARSNPGVGFIGVEPFEHGLAKAVTAVSREGLRNVRVYDQDAVHVLDWLPEKSIARIDLLFPDPWPKKRHWKRRFVKADNLTRIAHMLTEGGEFRFATDVESYSEWTRDQVAKHGGLALIDESAEPWSDWPGTRYEAKAARAGRGARYFTFNKP